MKYSTYEELPVWKASLKVTKEIFDLFKQPCFNRDFSLQDQMKRAVISISSNIAEGFEKNNNNEFSRFLRISKGSVGEARSQLRIAISVGYVSEREGTLVDEQLKNLAKQLAGLLKYLYKNKRAYNL